MRKRMSNTSISLSFLVVIILGMLTSCATPSSELPDNFVQPRLSTLERRFDAFEQLNLSQWYIQEILNCEHVGALCQLKDKTFESCKERQEICVISTYKRFKSIRQAKGWE